MRFSDIIRLLIFPTIFLVVGISFSGDYFYFWPVGFLMGLIVMELSVPGMVRDWERIGIPGKRKTPEQQEIWEREKTERGIKKNLSVLAAVFIAGAIRMTNRELFHSSFLLVCGLLTGYSLRWGWLIYRKRGKLGPSDK